MINNSIYCVVHSFLIFQFENIYIVETQDYQDNNGRLGYYSNCYSNSCG